jgi:hypothetical protein
MEAMPLSSKEKQAAFRERKKEQELFEVRGIFLPKYLHDQLKVLAEKLTKPKRKKPTATPKVDER